MAEDFFNFFLKGGERLNDALDVADNTLDKFHSTGMIFLSNKQSEKMADLLKLLTYTSCVILLLLIIIFFILFFFKISWGMDIVVYIMFILWIGTYIIKIVNYSITYAREMETINTSKLRHALGRTITHGVRYTIYNYAQNFQYIITSAMIFSILKSHNVKYGGNLYEKLFTLISYTIIILLVFFIFGLLGKILPKFAKFATNMSLYWFIYVILIFPIIIFFSIWTDVALRDILNKLKEFNIENLGDKIDAGSVQDKYMLSSKIFNDYKFFNTKKKLQESSEFGYYMGVIMLVIILIFDVILVYLSGKPAFINQINKFLKETINKFYESLNID
jgi:hypothetical protein